MKIFCRFVLIFSVVVCWSFLEAGTVAAKEPILIVTGQPPVDSNGRVIYRPAHVIYRIPATSEMIDKMNGRLGFDDEVIVTAACAKDGRRRKLVRTLGEKSITPLTKLD